MGAASQRPDGHPQLMPYLHYLDPAAAIEFLTRAFGFRLRFAHKEQSGAVAHAQLAAGDTTFALGPAHQAFGYAAASALPALHASFWCYVDDADAHCARARAAGARILRGPADQPYGVREYDALDCEGQEWYFCQPLDAAKIAPHTAGAKRSAKPKRSVKAKGRKPAKAARRPAKRKAAPRRKPRRR
jgi:uncharacterized glyoxalase superfamily protein PhnB